MTFIFFNLLFNSMLSLLIGLMLVQSFIWFFRVETGRWKLFLLSLPFVKIVYDFARGVPEKSILFSGIDPFSLPPNHQTLKVGAGIVDWTPYVSTIFSVKGLDGNSYHSSLGDYFLIWMQRKFGPEVPIAVVVAVLAVSMTLFAIRSVQYFKFEKQRREDRRTARLFRKVKLSFRVVDIYISQRFSGTPFTGGLLKPYICLPEDAALKLTAEELEAVIAHEMGHVRYYDLVVTVLIQTLGDLFWFVPGYRWLSRKIDRLREVVADRTALASRIELGDLASALLKLKEIPESQSRLVLYSAFFREKSLLKERVERLMGHADEPASRFGWKRSGVRYVATTFITLMLINSVFAGNFSNETVTRMPDWFNQWMLRKTGP